MDCSPPGSSVHGISQTRILEGVTISVSRGSSRSRACTHVSCFTDGFFTTEPPRNHTQTIFWLLITRYLLPTLEIFKVMLRNPSLRTCWKASSNSLHVWGAEVWTWVSESHSVVSDSLWPHGLYSPWNSPGQNTGVGSLSVLQGIFPTQGSNPGLRHCRQILYQLNH